MVQGGEPEVALMSAFKAVEPDRLEKASARLGGIQGLARILHRVRRLSAEVEERSDPIEVACRLAACPEAAQEGLPGGERDVFFGFGIEEIHLGGRPGI